MPSTDRRVIIACAGAGKTTRLVEGALHGSGQRVAMVTYTNNNAREIRTRFGEANSGVPPYVDVMTWFGFLLRECARPYQRAKYDSPPIDSIVFVNQQSTRYVKESNTAKYYISPSGGIYSDKIARFVVECEKMSGKSVSTRLAEMYTSILVDEFQDLAGWDLEVIRALFEAGLPMTLVGDPRQHIYSTNPAKKNKQYLGSNVLDLVKRWEKDDLCSVEYVDTTQRCPQEVCDFVNLLWPGMTGMISASGSPTGHVGVFLVPVDSVEAYYRTFRPTLLRHDKRSKDYGWGALNFGLAKGLQFDHVLIIPTEPIKKFLQTGDVDCVMNGRDRLHVAVTRACKSVGFIHDGPSPIVPKVWSADSHSTD